MRFLLLPGVRRETSIRQVHVPQVHGGEVGTFHAPFAARVTNGAILVMYLKGAPCALGGGGRYGRSRGHMPRGGQKPVFRSAKGEHAKVRLARPRCFQPPHLAAFSRGGLGASRSGVVLS